MWECNHASMTIMWILDYSFGLYFYGMLGKTQTIFFWCKQGKKEEIWLENFIIGKCFQQINVGRTSIAIPMSFSFVLPSHTYCSQFGLSLPLLVTRRTTLSLTNKKQPFVDFKSYVSNEQYWCSCFNETTLWLILKMQRCIVFWSYIMRARGGGSQCTIVHIKSYVLKFT